MKHTFLLLVPLAALTFAPSVQAADGPKIEVATPKNDDANYMGDRIWFRSAVRGYRVNLMKPDAEPVRVCIPAKMQLKGRVEATRKVEGKEATGWLFTAEAPRLGQFSSDRSDCADEKSQASDPTVPPIPSEGDYIHLSHDELKLPLPTREGWTYGALFVPYKSTFKGERDLRPSAALGGYFGWRFDRAGAISVKAVGFAGATLVHVPKLDAENKASIGTEPGLSYGFALLGEIKREFEIGLVIGLDHTAKSVSYPSKHKPWVALSLGYDFSR